MRCTLLSIAALLVLVLPAAAAERDRRAAFAAAWKLQEQGQTDEAFLAFAAIPGAQHLAVGMARTKPIRFLSLLRGRGQRIPVPFAKVIEGDLLLAKGLNKQALECYRQAIQRVAKSDNQDWADGRIPRRAYVTEPGFSSAGGQYGGDPFRQLGAPFSVGPGSHRDNWLLRRFITLEAWDDASAELARIWNIHRENTQPHFVMVPKRTDFKLDGVQKRLVRPVGFDGRGLQFALDYAFFLKQQKREAKASSLLLDVLLLIDMDRNPNWFRPIAIPAAEANKNYPLRPMRLNDRFVPQSAGVSRKEFIRLAYGAFKQSGNEQEMIAALQRKIAAGGHSARRILARLRLHQGNTEAAVTAELDYIQRSGLNSLSAALRRGMVYEQANRPAKAVAAYETALSLPDALLNLPDADEQISSYGGSQAFAIIAGHGSPATPQHRRADILGRLQRLYAGLGQAEKSFEVTLRLFETNPAYLNELKTLQQAQTRARVVGREHAFRDWMTKQVKGTKPANRRANLFWMLQDYDACAQAIAKDKTINSYSYSFQQWVDRFRTLGVDRLERFLTVLVEADSTNMFARLALLDLRKDAAADDATALFEQLLNADARIDWSKRKDASFRTNFADDFDLAYRLMRLYEKAQKIDKLRQLGLRIAAGEKPFGKWWEVNLNLYPYALLDKNMLPEHLNACLALTVQHADETTLVTLQQLLEIRGNVPALRQLARRKSKQFSPRDDLPEFGWANLPADVRLIASCENVMCLERDDKYVYSGHPWGVAVYDFAGNPITRIAIGQPVHTLAASNGTLWAGTDIGLFRIIRDDWSVGHLWMHGDVPEQKRHARNFVGGERVDNKVYSLTLDGDDLWITLHRNVQRLNTRTMTLRAWSYRELHLDSWAAFTQVITERDYVWVSGGHSSLMRYERATDTWQNVQNGNHPARLVGIVDGTLYGIVRRDDATGYYGPCIIDRKTLEVRSVRLADDQPPHEVRFSDWLNYFGTHNGRPVVGRDDRAFVIDRDTLTMRTIKDIWKQPEAIESLLPPDYRRYDFLWRWRSDGSMHSVQQKGSQRWTLLQLGDGRLLAGHRYLGTADRYARNSAVEKRGRNHGGLHFVTEIGRGAKISNSPRPDTIGGDVVFDIANDPQRKRKWLCTDYGLAVLDARDRVVARFNREDGLCANRVTSGLAMGNRLYFSTSWGNYGGGLAIFDPLTNVFTARFESDGLATNKLAKLERRPNSIKLIYSGEYGGHNKYHYRLFPPGEFDPKTDTVKAGGSPKHFNDSTWPKHLRLPKRKLPLLGGAALSEKTIDGKTYACGAHGLVIFKGRQPELKLAELEVRLILDPAVKLRAEAKQTVIAIKTPNDLRRFLKSPNPYVRAKAYATTLRAFGNKGPSPNFIPVLSTAIDDPNLRARATGLSVLSRVNDKSIAPTMRKALKDPDRRIRGLAAMALAQVGQPPVLAFFEEMMTTAVYNAPFDVESVISVPGTREGVYRALGQIATPEVYRLLLRSPPDFNSINEKSLFRPLGKSLPNHPQAVSLLLRVQDSPERNRAAREFARRVFGFAGVEILPELHEALKSDDRVIRSNAARGCGSVGNRSSIPYLVDALDLESGLSRASIVWALGELKAKQSIPHLVTLYIDARNDEKQRRGAGFRSAQSVAVYQSHFDSLRNLQSIGRDWSRLKQSLRAQPVDPRRNEELLSPHIILTAVSQIGSASAQQFYRRLAADREYEPRLEAAERLAEGGALDKPRNVPVLRNLLADQWPDVRMRAAVSLLILGDTFSQPQILAWLKSPNDLDRLNMFMQLKRIEDGNQLTFAKEAIARAPLPDNPYQKSRNTELKQHLLKLIRNAAARRGTSRP